MSTLTSPFLLRFLFIGLFACFSELQHPIRHSFSFRLDFCLHSHCFNVQSDTFFRPFWTSSVTFSTSTSNLTRFLIPFGLLLAIQSDMFSSPFWTSSVTFSTSTSNPPRRLTINHLQSHKCLHYNSALIISAALTIFLRLASVSGTPLVLSPQSGFTHNLSLSIFVSIIFIARVISSTDGILGE